MKKDKAYKEALEEWRRKYFDQLDQNMTVLISIRDADKTSAKDKNEACKTIARHLGALQPDRQVRKDEVKKKELDLDKPLSAEEQGEIEKRLNGL